MTPKDSSSHIGNTQTYTPLAYLETGKEMEIKQDFSLLKTAVVPVGPLSAPCVSQVSFSLSESLWSSKFQHHCVGMTLWLHAHFVRVS